jgi:hypothetical protein
MVAWFEVRPNFGCLAVPARLASRHGKAAVRGRRCSGQLPRLGQKARRWCGDPYELCPVRLLSQLNGNADFEKVTALLRFYRAQKR